MDKIELTTTERDALQSWRFHHPHPRVQRTMEALSLQSPGRAPEDIGRLCAMAKTTFSRSLHAYRAGDIEKLHEVSLPRRQRALADYRTSIEADVRQHPPARVAEAAARMTQLTGLARGPTQVRQFFKSLGMPPRKVGQIPAKADVTAQEAFKTGHLEPRLAEAKAGQRLVFFMEAAHVVFAPFWGVVWCCERLFVKAPSGRQRLKVLAAFNATTRELCPVPTLTDITSVTVCAFLRLLAGASPGVPITIVLDNARSQRGALVQSLAQTLGLALLFLPPYAPNLPLMERFWKFVKKPCLYSTYYADHLAFQQAILACSEEAPDKHQEELARLLPLQFQSFKAVQVIGEASHISLCPGARQRQRKVSSKAA